MNGEALLQDAGVILISLTLTLLFVLGWVFRTDQSKVPRNRRVAMMIARRLTLVFAGVFLLCVITGWSAWVVMLVAAILLLSMLSGHILGLAGIGIFYVLQQYVLGFPDRGDWFLEPPPQTTDIGSSLDVHLGKRGKTLSALKPSGEILIDNERLAALSEDGGYVDAGCDIEVCQIRNGQLVVRSLVD